MSVKQIKISDYLNKNYDFLDKNLLKEWVDYLNHNHFVKLRNDKLLWTSQGAKILSQYLNPIRKKKIKDYKIDLSQLIQKVPNEMIIFQKSKFDPIFPFIFFKVYLENKHYYDEFHQKYPFYPSTSQRQMEILQQDSFWFEKFRAGYFFYSPIDIQFLSTESNITIHFEIKFTNNNSLFIAKMKLINKEINTIDCYIQHKNIINLKLAILYILLTTYQYDQSSLIRQLENELINFQHLVPNFLSDFIKLYSNKTKFIKSIHNEYNKMINELRKTKTITSLLLQNFFSYPFTPSNISHH
jgi:hypothetical protein